MLGETSLLGQASPAQGLEPLQRRDRGVLRRAGARRRHDRSPAA